ncbi:hypothetical protein LAUMK13_05499 [Mycobacterium innocens]|uniref:Uncharacterized protein n=1 Tax=Mycobacterium innocens TaxID=2341083 RepID=A0A498QNA9_9MYCO|nr:MULTISPECIES: hypothetical protein [Mycobacterium]VBA45597.1 hypothetical protein LAUMK13_05499 [Mycobacterium innocens]
MSDGSASVVIESSTLLSIVSRFQVTIEELVNTCLSRLAYRLSDSVVGSYRIHRSGKAFSSRLDK